MFKPVGQIFSWHHSIVLLGFLPGEFGPRYTFPLCMGAASYLGLPPGVWMQGIYTGPRDVYIRMES